MNYHLPKNKISSSNVWEQYNGSCYGCLAVALGTSITIRAIFLPFPCNLNALFKVSVLRSPIQFASDLSRVAIHLGVIAGSAWKEVYFDVNTCSLFTSTHKLLDRPTFSSANIVDAYFTRFCLFKSFDMGINKIGNINIISNACSVRCVIVCSCNLQGGNRYNKLKFILHHSILVQRQKKSLSWFSTRWLNFLWKT